jgi:hypothetical protein
MGTTNQSINQSINQNKKNGLPVVLKKIGHTAVLRLTQHSPFLFTISRL